jgi:hypothetical protein
MSDDLIRRLTCFLYAMCILILASRVLVFLGVEGAGR